MSFERLTGIASRADLLKRLDTIKVVSALSFCPYKRHASAEYLAGRGVGEQALAQQVRALDLLGNAKTAFDKLLVEGFYCGFDLGPGAQSTASAPAMICTKVPSKVKFCFESKLVMDVEWPTKSYATSQLIGALESAEVKAVRSSCEVPAIEGKGERL